MSQNRPENPSHPASSFMKLSADDGSSVFSSGVLGCVAGRRGDHFPSALMGREAEADQWRQVELGMG